MPVKQPLPIALKDDSVKRQLDEFFRHCSGHFRVYDDAARLVYSGPDGKELPTAQPGGDRSSWLERLDSEVSVSVSNGRPRLGRLPTSSGAPLEYVVVPVCTVDGDVDFVATWATLSPEPELDLDADLTIEALIDAVPDGILLVDPADRVVMANRSLEEIVGSDPGGLRGRALDRLLPDFLDTAHQADEPLPEALFSPDQGATLVTESGERVLVTAAQRRIRTDLDFIKVVLVRDTQTVMALEQRLRRSEDQLRLLTDSATNYAIFAMDVRGRILSWNKGAERIKGYTADEIIGRHFSCFYTESDRQAGLPTRALQIATKTGRFEDRGLRLRKDGSMFWADVTLSAMRARDGRLLGFSKVTRDITDRIQREERRRQAQERAIRQLSRVCEQVSDGVLVTDRLGQIEYVNPAFEQTTGYSKSELEGRTPALLNSGQHSEELFKELWTTVLEGRIFSATLVNRRKDGELYYQKTIITPLTDEDGEITNLVSTGHDITDQVRLEQELERRSTHDILTGLPTRWHFNAMLSAQIVHASLQGQQIGLIYLSVEHLKRINDGLGHIAGDHLLKVLATRFSQCLLPHTVLGRVNGNEFSVSVPIDESDRTERVVELVTKLRDTAERGVVVDGQSVFTNVDVGVAIYPTDGESADTLLRNAASACNRAKRQGHRRFEFYRPEINAGTADLIALETALRAALDKDEFELYYQPQVDIQSGQLKGFEALLRWVRPGVGVVPPAEFIPFLEESGLIVQVGEWALREACRRSGDIHRSTSSPVRIAVNVSPQQLARGDFVDVVRRVVSEEAIAPGTLELEITEHTLMHDIELGAELLVQLARLGVRIAVDDFGTGYSSLGYLKKLPVHSLKIDGSFIRDVTTSAHDEAIVDASISLGHRLGLEVIAEHVETLAQWDLLKSRGCDTAQGYYISRPMEPAATQMFIESYSAKAFSPEE